MSYSLERLETYKVLTLQALKPYKNKKRIELSETDRKIYDHYHKVLDELNCAISKAKDPPRQDFLRKIYKYDLDRSYPDIPF